MVAPARVAFNATPGSATLESALASKSEPIATATRTALRASSANEREVGHFGVLAPSCAPRIRVAVRMPSVSQALTAGMLQERTWKRISSKLEMLFCSRKNSASRTTRSSLISRSDGRIYLRKMEAVKTGGTPPMKTCFTMDSTVLLV
jgi:hypothetical protein